MPARGIHHISLTVNDLTISEPFYDKLTEALGFKKQGLPEQRVVFYSSPEVTLIISGARPENKGAVFDRFRVGLHHLSFRVESRTDVEVLHRLLQRSGATVLDAPAEYPQYQEGYYAAYFADPDGIKLEVVHTPGGAPVADEPEPPVVAPKAPAPKPVATKEAPSTKVAPAKEAPPAKGLAPKPAAAKPVKPVTPAKPAKPVKPVKPAKKPAAKAKPAARSKPAKSAKSAAKAKKKPAKPAKAKKKR